MSKLELTDSSAVARPSIVARKLSADQSSSVRRPVRRQGMFRHLIVLPIAVISCAGLVVVNLVGPTQNLTGIDSAIASPVLRFNGEITQSITASDSASAQTVSKESYVAVEKVVPLTIPNSGSSIPNSGSSLPSIVPDPGSAQGIAAGLVAARGWDQGEFNCLVALWSRESGWRVNAANPSSGAYGIPQALPGSKMATAGADWQTNPATQIAWGLNYIGARYGTPCGAWGHSESFNWY